MSHNNLQSMRPEQPYEIRETDGELRARLAQLRAAGLLKAAKAVEAELEARHGR